LPISTPTTVGGDVLDSILGFILLLLLDAASR
jgi:hypothetical protein